MLKVSVSKQPQCEVSPKPESLENAAVFRVEKFLLAAVGALGTRSYKDYNGSILRIMPTPKVTDFLTR